MSQLPILWILPLFALTSQLIATAGSSAPILPMTLGQEYTGSLTPSPSNPQGEVCYRLAVKPNTRITLNVKTSGVGIIKFAIYDKTKSLRFFHNNVVNKSSASGNAPADSRFSFPAINDASQLCLTTSNTRRSQQYDLIVTAKPSRKPTSSLKLRPINSKPITTLNSSPKRSAAIPTVTAPIPPTVPIATTIATVEIPPSGVPYCYVGTWQINDLAGYWLPNLQNFTQAQVTNLQMLGYAKVTMTKDGRAIFEAIDLQQQYALKSKATGAKFEKIGINLDGASSAKFQPNSDGTLTFNSQDYRRLATRLNLGSSLKLSGDQLFMLFGDRDLPPVRLPYKCLDRDRMTLRVPLPTGQNLMPISLKRVN